MANPIAIAAKGKGYGALWKRARTINQRYGLTAAKMDNALQRFVAVLQPYDCGATFPITAVALARNGPVIAKYQAQNIEFAIHGLFHVDYSQLSLDEQASHIQQARQIFQREQITLAGFRCPYLRWNKDTLIAVGNNKLSYDSSQALHWDVVVHEYVTDDYRRVLEFYGAEPAALYPALPAIRSNIVEIPYCVPDDESLIDRLKLTDPAAMSKIWLAILEQTHKLGELFTLGLHPERIGLLEEPLGKALARARQLSPVVWIARLDEISEWWQARRTTQFELTTTGPGRYHLAVQGPAGLTLLAHDVAVKAPTEPWQGNDIRVLATNFEFESARRPCLGLSPGCPPALASFLKQQGYWVETTTDPQAYTIYLDQAHFNAKEERPLLDHLAHLDAPLIRAGRWPNGAQSAMCVTGDIDALTLWDYGLRFLGN